MPVKPPPRQYSKAVILNLLVVVVLGWLMLLGWSLSLWARFGFEQASERLSQLATQQRAVLLEFHDVSVTDRLNSVVAKLPIERLTEIHHTFQNAIPDLPITRVAWEITQDVWLLVGLSAHVMLTKMLILIAAIPLFFLAMTAGLVDGLNQRAIRTASLGRESSYVFHQLNRFFKRGLMVLLGAWLAIPVSIAPALMLVPVSVMLSVMVSVTASRFKKYL